MPDSLLSLYDRAPGLLDEPTPVVPDADEIWRRSVGATSRPSRPAPRRARSIALVAAGAAAALVLLALLPGGMDRSRISGPPGAVAAVHHAARAAAAAAYDPIPAGRYGYLHQRMTAPNGTTEVEYWYGPSGGRAISTQPDGTRSSAQLPRTDPLGLPPVGLALGGLVALDRHAIEGLPTEPGALGRALDRHVARPDAGTAGPGGTPSLPPSPSPQRPQGQHRTPSALPPANARWEMIVQILQQQRTTPALRAAAIDLAADVPGIVVDAAARDPLGRAALRLSPTVPGPAGDSRPRVVLYLDPDTGATLATQMRAGGTVEATIVTVSTGVVDRLTRRP